MRKLLFISGLCVVFAASAYAQDKDNKTPVDTIGGKANSRITVVKLDNIVNLDTVSPENYPKPLPIPNALEERPLAVKDVSVPMPHKKLTGEESAMMPGTEKLDKGNNKVVEEHLRQIRPLKQDSVRKKVRPKK